VLLGGDRVLLGRGHDLEFLDLDLVPTGRSLVRPDPAPNHDRGLLRQAGGLLEGHRREVRPKGRALDGARAVPDLEEEKLPARPPGRQPTTQGHCLTYVPTHFGNVDHRHGRVNLPRARNVKKNAHLSGFP
jgi:hypothetical protein